MKNRRIVFLGTHGQMNIGDELLLETFLSQLGTENHFYVNSYAPEFTAAHLRPTYEVEVYDTAGERVKLLRYILSSDLLFFGGGSIIKELYASVGRGPYATLLMVLAIVTFARRIARKPIVMSNIGVGPLHTPRGRQLAGWILRQVNILSVRDRKSYDTCLELGLTPDRVQLVPDAVFANASSVFVGDRAATPKMPATQDKLKIALNLNFDIENPANWETFQQNLAESLLSLNKRHPLEIHTLPMQSEFKKMHDARVLAEFCTRIPEIPVHTHATSSHQDAAAVIAQCDLVLSERLHALVMAAILGKPVVALVYDVKVNELMAGLDMQAYSININHPFDPQVLTKLLEQALDRREEVSLHLLQHSERLRQELKTYFDSLEGRLDPAKGH